MSRGSRTGTCSWSTSPRPKMPRGRGSGAGQGRTARSPASAAASRRSWPAGSPERRRSRGAVSRARGMTTRSPSPPPRDVTQGPLLAPAPAGRQACLQAQDFSAVDDVLARFDEDDFGLVVGTAEGGRLLGYGGGLTSADAPIIASSTKLLSTSVILSLVDRGVLSLEDPVGDVLEGWPADKQGGDAAHAPGADLRAARGGPVPEPRRRHAHRLRAGHRRAPAARARPRGRVHARRGLRVWGDEPPGRRRDGPGGHGGRLRRARPSAAHGALWDLELRVQLRDEPAHGGVGGA